MAERPRPRSGDNRESRPSRGGRPSENRRPPRTAGAGNEDMLELADELEEYARSLLQAARRLQRMADRTGGDAGAERPRSGSGRGGNPRADRGERSERGDRGDRGERPQRRERSEGQERRPSREGRAGGAPGWVPKRGGSKNRGS